MKIRLIPIGNKKTKKCEKQKYKSEKSASVYSFSMKNSQLSEVSGTWNERTSISYSLNVIHYYIYYKLFDSKTRQQMFCCAYYQIKINRNCEVRCCADKHKNSKNEMDTYEKDRQHIIIGHSNSIDILSCEIA